MHENTGRISKKSVRSDQDGIDVKSDVNGREGMVSIGFSGKATYGRFWHQGRSGGGLRCLTLKGWEPIRGSESMEFIEFFTI